MTYPSSDWYLCSPRYGQKCGGYATFIPEILQHPLVTGVCSRKILHHFRMPQETYLDG